jgi:hypothetical protein
MPDTGVGRKRQISARGIWSGHDSMLANEFLKAKQGSAAFDLTCALADRGPEDCSDIAGQDSIHASRDARIRMFVVKYRNAF